MKPWQEAFEVAWDALRANKVRALLTTLGVVIGSACIVLVVTVALTGRKFVLGQIEAAGSNLAWAEYVETAQHSRALSYELTPGDVEVRCGRLSQRCGPVGWYAAVGLRAFAVLP